MTEAQLLAERIETENYEAASMIRRLEAECEALRLELDLCGQLKRGYQEQAALAAEECEALRKDAERYRWILRNYLSADLTDLALKAGNLDAAIDAAMGKEKA